MPCNTKSSRRSSTRPLQGMPWERGCTRVRVPASDSSPAVGFLFEPAARACISLLLMGHGRKASAPFCFGKRENIPQVLFVYFGGFCVCVCARLTHSPMKHILVMCFSLYTRGVTALPMVWKPSPDKPLSLFNPTGVELPECH